MFWSQKSSFSVHERDASTGLFGGVGPLAFARPSTFFTSLLLATFFLTFFSRAASAYDGIVLKHTITVPTAVKSFSPIGVAFDSLGKVWMTDTDHDAVFLYSDDKEKIRRVGHQGTAPGQWNKPHGVATDWAGNVYVADSGNARIQVFSSEGKLVRTFGEKGNAPGQWNRPWNLAAGRGNVLVVSDKDSARIQFFTTDGIFLQAFDVEAPIDGLTMDAEGNVYAVQENLKEINEWSPEGQHLKTITGMEPGVHGFAKPLAITVADSGLLYVADNGPGQFRELDSAGHTDGTFGRSGSGEGQFRSLDALDVMNDVLAVADSRNHRVSLFTLSRQAPIKDMTTLPTFQFQIRRQPSLAMDANRLAWGSSGLLHALSFARDEILSLNTVTKSSTTLDLKKSFGIKAPSGLATSSADGFFVSDAGGSRVLKISTDGGKPVELGKATGFFKSGQGELSKPQGVTCSATGMVLVANTGNKRIDVFNSQGLFQFSGGEKGHSSGQLETPVSVAWDKKRLYVADPGNHKVVVFNASGRWLADLTTLGPEALLEPRQVSVDKEGYVFVLDTARSRFVLFNAEGHLIGAFGSAGRSEGFFNHPRGFTLSDNDDLYVAEDGGRVQVFHVAILPPAPTGVSAVASEGYVTLQWDPVKTRFPARYTVYRSTPGADTQKLQETVETKITDDALTSDTTCVYTIVAQSILGASSAPSEPLAIMAHAKSVPPLEIVSAQIDDVFSADYKSYSRETFGHVVIHNNSPASVSKIKVAFDVTDYMDFPSEIPIAELPANGSQDVPLTATFNNKILQVSETTPIQAQLKVTYYSKGGELSVVKDLPFKLFSRNSIRWDQKERLAAFVTPNDPPLLDFARSVTIPFLEAHQGAPLPAPLVNAWAVFSGLGVYGLHYLERPNNPYDRVSLDSNTVDSLQYARETLSRKSGDCADMVALLASALESVTVTTVALDAPGHLFLMMDTGETDLKTLGFPENMVVPYAGTYWIPLEATMIDSPFMDAWKRGAEEYHQWSQKNQLGIVDIHLAWAKYEPVTLPESSEHLQGPSRQDLEGKSINDWKALVELRWQTRFDAAKAAEAVTPGSGAPWIDMGVLAVQYHRLDEAHQFFTKAKADPKTASAAANNLGNLAYLKGDASSAEVAYQAARAQDPNDAQINLNLTRLYLKSKDPTKAAATYDKAISLNASLKDRYPAVSSLEP